MDEEDWTLPVRAVLSEFDGTIESWELLMRVPVEVLRRNEWSLGVDLIPAVIDVAEAQGGPTWQLWMALAVSQFRTGESIYQATFERAAAEATTPSERAQVMGNLGRIQRFDGLLPAALRSAASARSLYKSENNEIGIAQATADTAMVQQLLGDFDGAIDSFCEAIANLVVLDKRLAEGIRAEALETQLREHPRAAEVARAGLIGDESSVDRPLEIDLPEDPDSAPLQELRTGLVERITPYLGLGAAADPHPLFAALVGGPWTTEMSQLDPEQLGQLSQEIEAVVGLGRDRSDASQAHHVSSLLIRNGPKRASGAELRRALERAKIACQLARGDPAPERMTRWLGLSNVYHDMASDNRRYLTFAFAAMRRAMHHAADCDAALKAHVDVQYSNLLISRGADADHELAATLLNSAMRFASSAENAGLFFNALNRLAALFANWHGDDRVMHLQQADRFYQFAIAHAEEFGHHSYSASMKHQRANVLRSIGGAAEMGESRLMYEAALAGLANVPSSWASVADDFASLLMITGDEPAAIEMRERAVDQLRRVGSSADLAIALGNLGSDHSNVSDRQADVADILVSLRRADDAYNEALDTEYSREPSRWRALQLRRRGLIRQRLAFHGGGALENALDDLDAAHELALRFEPADAVITYAEVYADALASVGLFARAHQLYTSALHGYDARYIAQLSAAARAETVEAALACAHSASIAAFEIGEFETGLAQLEVWPGRLLGGLGDATPERRSEVIDALHDTIGGTLLSGAVARDIVSRTASSEPGPTSSSLRADLRVIGTSHDVVLVFPTRRCVAVSVLQDSTDPADFRFTCVGFEPEEIVDAVLGLLEPGGRPIVLIDQLAQQFGLHTFPSTTGSMLIDRSPVVHHRSFRSAAASRSDATPLTSYQAVGAPTGDLRFAAAELAASSDLIAASGSGLEIHPSVKSSDLTSLGAPSGSILHLACHGQAHAHPMATALVFADHSLTVADLLVSMVSRDAGLIVVSSCDSAVSEASFVSEPFSVAAALHVTGVATIGTFEPVNDLAAALLVVRFFEELTTSEEHDGDGPASLAQAQRWLRGVTAAELTGWLVRHPELRKAIATSGPELLEVIDRGDVAPFSHQSFWAPFAYFGW